MIYEDIMPVRASCVLVTNGISVALLSTGAYLQGGLHSFSLFMFFVRVNWIACETWASRCKLGGCLVVGLISQRGHVACAAIDRGGGGVWTGRCVPPSPAREKETYARQLITLVQLIMCQRHFVNQRQPA